MWCKKGPCVSSNWEVAIENEATCVLYFKVGL